MKEVWKTISVFTDYMISNLGKVKSLKFNKEKILKQIKNSSGYFYITLCQNKERSRRQIHVLLFETFNDYKLKDCECVHHDDKHKENNYINNLKLMTKFDHHSLHSSGKRNGMFRKKHSEKTKLLMSENHADFKGENHPRSKLTKKDIIEIRRLNNEGKLTQNEISRLFKINQSTVSKIKFGIRI